MPVDESKFGLSAARQVWEGATRPSLTAVAGTLLLVVFQLAAMSGYWTPERMAAMDRTLLLKYGHDYDAWVTMTAHRLRYQPAAGLDVLYVTNSSGRHSIQSVEAVSQQVSDLVGEPVRFEMLATGAQTLWEAEILLDQLADNFRGVVIISTSVNRLTSTPEQLQHLASNPRLGLDSVSHTSRLHAAGIATPQQSGVYLLVHARFFALRRRALMKNLLLGTRAYTPHRYRDGEFALEREWIATTPRFMKRMQRFEEYSDANFKVLSEVIGRLRKRGIQVALNEAPRHPRLVQLFGDDFEIYQDAVQSFARAESVPLWQLDDTVALQASEFRDWGHITEPAARERYQAELGRRIAVMLNTKKEESTK
jgi:hypothetical protein